MAVISGVGNILHALINAVVSFFGIIISFFTCGYCGGSRRRSRGTTTRTRRSRI